MRAYFGILFFIFSLTAKAEFQVPPLRGPVMDLAGVMTSQDRDRLGYLIQQFHNGGKGQLQVLTVQSLEGSSIEEASIKVTDQWKLGDAKKDDGVLILVAMQDRKLRIEVGQGLEGVLPDIKAKQIVSDVMTPYFRQGIPSQGIIQGAAEVMRTIDADLAASGMLPEKMQARSGKKKGSLWDRFEGIFVLIFILFIIFGNISRPGPGGFGGGGGGWGGVGFGGGGFGGGGGGWGGGGGGFSGGGASGSW